MRGITHAGMFHADDVLSAAFLYLTFGITEFVRTNDVNSVDIGEDDIVFDIGGGKFDHHQKDSPVRQNGIPYAAFGLLWKEYAGKLGLNAWAINRFDEDFAQYIDQTDNFGQAKYPNTFSAMVSAMWNKDIDNFNEVVTMTVPFLDGLIKRYLYLVGQYKAAEKEIYGSENYGGVKGQVSVFVTDTHYDSQVLTALDVKYVIEPALRAPVEYKDTAVSLRSMDSENYPIEAVEGKDGCYFIHKNKFTSGFDTKESAISAAKSSLCCAYANQGISIVSRIWL